MKMGDKTMDMWRFVLHLMLPKIAYWFGVGFLNPKGQG